MVYLQFCQCCLQRFNSKGSLGNHVRIRTDRNTNCRADWRRNYRGGVHWLLREVEEEHLELSDYYCDRWRALEFDDYADNDDRKVYFRVNLENDDDRVIFFYNLRMP